MRYTLLLALCAAPALADSPVIEDVRATRTGDTWRFDVTVRHADTGWEHYADGWSILDAAGAELGYRELLHPHVTEQPFTRSLTGVSVPHGLGEVTLRAHDSVHGWGASVVVPLE